MVDIWAHSCNGAGPRHRLKDHLCGTAERARSFGGRFGAGELAAYLGLVHDIGKASARGRRAWYLPSRPERAVLRAAQTASRALRLSGSATKPRSFSAARRKTNCAP